MNKPYIIAEVGSNFLYYGDCVNSIAQAKAAGASAVKFQLYTHEELYGVKGTMKGQLDPAWLKPLAEKAAACGIDIMCTAFSPEGYELINPLVKMHKVASAEATHLRILQKLRSFNKPVILSTGAKGKDDIRMSLKELQSVPVTLLYCVAAYPAMEVNLDTIETLRHEFGVDVGFSDHTRDIYNLPKLACAQGATVIEKHFTVIPEADTPDNPHSLNPDQFRNMVKSIRGQITPIIAPTSEELPMLLRYNRRIIATKDIGVGEVLEEGRNMGIFRSLQDDTRAAHPFLIDRLNGKQARVEIKAGTGIWLEDVQDGASNGGV